MPATNKAAKGPREQLGVYVPKGGGVTTSIRRLARRLEYSGAAELIRAALSAYLRDHQDRFHDLQADLDNALEGLQLRDDLGMPTATNRGEAA
jgi:Arc/MetJ-type ribon-helix-helix transcriptional regulator